MRTGSVVEHSLQSIVTAMAHALEAEELAKQNGLLQRLDPRVKAIGLSTLIVAVAVSHRISVILTIFCLAVLLAVFSRISVWLIAKRVWIGVFFFTAAIATPALFTTPGQVVGYIPPLGLRITCQGFRSAAFLVTRTETAATLALLLVLSTPWAQLLKALRTFRVPAVLVAILSMTHRYIFLLLETAREMFESRQSRTVGHLDGPQRRRMTTRTAGVLMDKSLHLSNDVYAAMRSRGFAGEVRTLSQFNFRAADYVALGLFLMASAAAFWTGR